MNTLRAERAYPIKGIREDLPEGERVLWQGKPDWLDLAHTAFHLRQVAVYFGLLLALRAAFAVSQGEGPLALVPLLLMASAGLALLAGLAWWSARSTIYAITTRRIVMRVGMALPLDINLPYAGIREARLAQRHGGFGDLPLALQGDVHLAYVHLWPYARPWKLAHPEPMMRAVPEAARVAQILAQALAATGGTALAAAPAAPARNAPHPMALPT